MESEKISQSLKDSRLGEAQNPYHKTLEMSTGPGFFDVSNVDVGKELGGENADASCSKGLVDAKDPLVGGNGVLDYDTNNGSLAEEGNAVINMGNNDEVPVLEVDSSTEVDGVKEKDAIQYYPGKVEDSENGLTLFVEVFGPLNGIGKSDEAHGLEGRSTEQENSGEETSVKVSGEAKQASEVGSVVVYDLQCPFIVGDLVWVKTKTQLWWPAIVCDPSNASKDTAKSDKWDCILVKYLDNAKIFWCSPSQLKPFLENLEHMSKQNNSRSFLAALDKAIGEISRRIKMEMTCSCFSKESPRGVSGVFPSSQFEPTTFLSAIKYLAKCIFLPDKLDFAIIQNCLSAFYHSIGHLQLPMHQLRPTNEDKSRAQDNPESKRETKFSEGDSIGSQKFGISSTEGREFSGDGEIPSAETGHLGTGRKSMNGVGSRERRKSKYLSYPYVNVNQGPTKTPAVSEDETEDPKHDSSLGAKTDTTSNQCATSTPITTSTGRTKKKGSRKPFVVKSTHCKIDVTKLSSAKMLIDLQLTALNCHYPAKSECFDSFRNFFSSFRKFAFGDQKLDNQQESCHQIQNPDLREEMSHQSSKVNPKRRERKKKEKICPSGPAPSPATIGLSTSANDTREMRCEASKTPKVPKKRKNKAETTPGAAGLLDLIGNKTTLSVQDQCKLEPKRRKKKNVLASGCAKTEYGAVMPGVNGNSIEVVIPLLKDMRGSVPRNNIESIDETIKPMASQSNATEHIASQYNDILPPSAKPERKKRKRKEKTLNPPDTNGVSGIPDLNGNVADAVTSGKDLPGMSSAAPEVKPKQRRRRRKKTDAGIPPISSNYSAKIENHIEALGAILLLNFVTGSPLPSKDSLVSTFSVYGAVKESETRVLNDSSAQIVFVKSSDAGIACRSLEKNNPFGASLAGFRLNYLGSGSRNSEQINCQVVPTKLSPLKPHHDGDPPNLHMMKRNLDMMTSMLEKAGNNLSPETKAKLEREIKGFKTKVSSLVGPP